MSRPVEQGFTLLELIIAIAIFAVLSMSAYQVLQGVMLNDEISQKKSARLAELQRTFMLLERDFSSVIQVASRPDSGLPTQVFAAQPHLLQSDDWGVSFVRNSWINPAAMLSRSDQERLAYSLRNNQLERMNFDYPDPIPGADPYRTVILSGVTAFRLRFFVGGNWQTHWDDPLFLPEGIEVTLELDDVGTLSRIFKLVTPGVIDEVQE